VIVVTGATGHLGGALTRRLAQALANDEPLPSPGPLRVVIRPGGETGCLKGLDIEVVEADILDLNSLVAAFQSANVVFHLAGKVSIASSGLRRLRKINVEGTKNVVEACRRTGVDRLVYTSSAHALVETPVGTCIDEDTPIDHLRTRGPYAKSKAEATQSIFAAARDGLDFVVTFPSGVIGPFDFKPSRIGQFIISCARGRMLAYVDGAYNFVDSRDVAEGLVAAWRHGRAGEGYLLCGSEVTVRQLLDLVEVSSGVPAPRLRLNHSFIRALSRLTPVYYWVTRQRPLFTTYALDVLVSNCFMSFTKAEQELGFSPRPFRDTIQDTVTWFREQGMIQQKSLVL
jgi:dihydroflavonol-4-reductase